MNKKIKNFKEWVKECEDIEQKVPHVFYNSYGDSIHCKIKKGAQYSEITEDLTIMRDLKTKEVIGVIIKNVSDLIKKSRQEKKGVDMGKPEGYEDRKNLPRCQTCKHVFEAPEHDGPSLWYCCQDKSKRPLRLGEAVSLRDLSSKDRIRLIRRFDEWAFPRRVSEIGICPYFKKNPDKKGENNNVESK